MDSGTTTRSETAASLERYLRDKLGVQIGGDAFDSLLTYLLDEFRLSINAGESLAEIGAVQSTSDSAAVQEDAVRLQPLRIPPGWKVDWNTFMAIDPTEEAIGNGYFGGSCLFSSTSEQKRLWVDVEWHPEHDPSGEFRLRVEYVPWERTALGRRRKDVPVDFRNSQLVHSYQTRDRLALIEELESVLNGRPQWIEHS